MLDVTDLVLEDHHTMRRHFALLDDVWDDPRALGLIWKGLARLLDVHAACEEEVFYPYLLKYGDSGDDDSTEGDVVDETDDAIGDHDEIRDAVAAAGKEEPGTEAWWTAVRKAREENDDHLAEEEHDALPGLPPQRLGRAARRAGAALAGLAVRARLRRGHHLRQGPRGVHRAVPGAPGRRSGRLPGGGHLGDPGLTHGPRHDPPGPPVPGGRSGHVWFSLPPASTSPHRLVVQDAALSRR